MKNFSEVTDGIIAASKEYYEIDEQIGNMYLDAISVFVETVQKVYNEEEFKTTRNDYQLAVFESIFKVDIKEELSVLAKEALERHASGEMAQDIQENNADKALLDSIRANIDAYIKE